MYSVTIKGETPEKLRIKMADLLANHFHTPQPLYTGIPNEHQLPLPLEAPELPELEEKDEIDVASLKKPAKKTGGKRGRPKKVVATTAPKVETPVAVEETPGIAVMSDPNDEILNVAEPTTVKTYSKDEVMQALKKVNLFKGLQIAHQILAKYGIKGPTTIQEKDHTAIVTDCLRVLRTSN